MYWDSSARLARSTSFCRTRSSLSRMRPATNARGRRDGEQHRAEQPRGRVGGDVALAAQLLPDGVHQDRDGGDRREEQGAAGRQQEGQRPTGTNSRSPRPLDTPPLECRISISTVMSTAACITVCTPAVATRRRTTTTFRRPNSR